MVLCVQIKEDDDGGEGLLGMIRCWSAKLAFVVLATGLVSGCSSASPQTTVLNVGCSPEPVLGTPSMPSPERLAATLTFTFNHIRLYPPPAGVSPEISADRAWNAVVRTKDPAHGLQLDATYRLILTEWNSKTPTIASSAQSRERLLVWLVIGKHIWVSTLDSSNHIRTPRCIYESAMWPVNATTGLLYGQMAYPPAAEVYH
jgi:hypothetical protein